MDTISLKNIIDSEMRHHSDVHLYHTATDDLWNAIGSSAENLLHDAPLVAHASREYVSCGDKRLLHITLRFDQLEALDLAKCCTAVGDDYMCLRFND